MLCPCQWIPLLFVEQSAGPGPQPVRRQNLGLHLQSWPQGLTLFGISPGFRLSGDPVALIYWEISLGKQGRALLFAPPSPRPPSSPTCQVQREGLLAGGEE